MWCKQSNYIDKIPNIRNLIFHSNVVIGGWSLKVGQVNRYKGEANCEVVHMHMHMQMPTFPCLCLFLPAFALALGYIALLVIYHQFNSKMKPTMEIYDMPDLDFLPTGTLFVQQQTIGNAVGDLPTGAAELPSASPNGNSWASADSGMDQEILDFLLRPTGEVVGDLPTGAAELPSASPNGNSSASADKAMDEEVLDFLMGKYSQSPSPYVYMAPTRQPTAPSSERPVENKPKRGRPRTAASLKRTTTTKAAAKKRRDAIRKKEDLLFMAKRLESMIWLAPVVNDLTRVRKRFFWEPPKLIRKEIASQWYIYDNQIIKSYLLQVDIFNR